MQIFSKFERLDQKLLKGGYVPLLKHFNIIIRYKTSKNTQVQIFIKIGQAWVILFTSRTVSKHKVQLLTSKVCAILYLLKEEVANPHPLKKMSQNIIKKKKNFGLFLIFWERWGREGVERG